MTSKEKSIYWQQHISSWKSSDQTQRDYCEQNNLSFATFGYWRTRLNKSRPPGKSKLVPVRIKSNTGLAKFSLPNGVCLEVPVEAIEAILPVISRSVEPD